VEHEGEWSATKWLSALGISKLITKALKVPPRDETPAFDYVKRLTAAQIEEMCSAAGLSGLAPLLVEGVEKLRAQKVGSSTALNDKFQASGKFEMSYGSLSLFYGGLESLLGPPQMHKDPDLEDSPATLLKAMENEHCKGDDALVPFDTSNGMRTHSALEWEAVTAPRKGAKGGFEYPERASLRDSRPDCCRRLRSKEEMCEVMEEQCNSRLRKESHSEMIVEEMLAGRLYTGPMYMKYNAVLRAKSKADMLIKAWKALCMGNDYVTTIHAINSCVLKLSKLTKAAKVWRGIKDARLPPEFWVPNEMGVRGGIEYGFSSTTTDKAQAQAYASGHGGGKHGDAMTIFEMQMGMVDRGADLTWLSQYPHEREVLLPPLTGIEALTSDVDGSMLVIHSRLSLNMQAQTLEQVLSRRRKMLMDMAKGIELELRDSLTDEALYKVALKILRRSLEYGAYSHLPEWFNNDDNFARVMQETLYLQRTLVNEVSKLAFHLDKPELSFKGWKARGPARVMLLAGFMHARTGSEAVHIDLRDAELTAYDGVQLAELLSKCPRLTAVDVRGNESLGEEGSRALVEFMRAQKVKSSVSVPRSLSGVTPSRSQLLVPKSPPPFEMRLLCAELEANVFAEGVSASMGGGSKGGGKAATLNRRGAQAAEAWQPLIWAAKDNNLLIAEAFLDSGHDVNRQEAWQDKGNSGYAPLHWAAQKGHLAMTELLLARGANPLVVDKHGNNPYSLAEKKGEKEVLAVLEPAMAQAHKSGLKPPKGGGGGGGGPGGGPGGGGGGGGPTSKSAKSRSASGHLGGSADLRA
jgi:hypothetical protein